MEASECLDNDGGADDDDGDEDDGGPDNDGGADDVGQLMTCLLSQGLIYSLLTLTSPNDPAYLTTLTSNY